MKVFGYARVSKQEQAVETNSLDQQVARLKNAGAEVVLVDVESGRSNTRKHFNELLKLVEQGQVREIIITRIDRLGRSVVTIAKAFELFEKCKVKVRILDAPIDATSPFGWLSINQMSGLAEFESRLLAQRINHGMAFFRQQGKVYQKAPFGYRKNTEGKLEPNNDIHSSGKTYWEIARENIDKLLTGTTIRQLSKDLHEEYNIKMSGGGLRGWVENPSLRGHTSYFRRQDKPYFKGKEIQPTETIYNTHEALFTDQEYSTIKKNLANNRKNFTSNKPGKYPLVGKLQCASCGGSMYRRITPYVKKTELIRCSKRSRGTHLCSNKKNTNFELILKKVVSFVTLKAEEIVNEIELSKKTKGEPNKEVVELQKQLAALEILRSTNPAIVTAIQDLKLQIINFEAMQSRKLTLVETNKNSELWQSYSQADFWESLSREDLELIFAEIIEAVVIDESGDVCDIKFAL
jgi:site-specific DNA recombinase